MRNRKGMILSMMKKSSVFRYIVIAAVIIGVIFTVVKHLQSRNAIKEELNEIEGNFSAHFIDIGQGDATLLQSPDGKFMLIDCGPPASSDKLVKYLNNCGVKSLEYLLITHPHDDHYGGVFEVIESFEVENLIIHKDSAKDNAYKKIISNLDKDTKVIKTKKGDKFTFAGCADFEIIAPKKVDLDDPNNSSLCFRVVYKDTSFMFTGDAEKELENEMLYSGYKLKSNVFHAGHHGSSTSNTEDFIRKVNPDIAVISCEKDNEYGHPHRETVKVFKDYGITSLRTDVSGNIVVVSDGKNISYRENFLNGK